MSNLTPPQLRLLFRQVNPNRVSHLRGMSHMEAWDIRRQLIRAFGFGGWDFEVVTCELIREHGVEKTSRDGKPYTAWTVIYRVIGRLRIRDVGGRQIALYEDGATGDSVNQPSLGDAHDMALKTAVSQALKRCAVNLGDGFGLSLYNDGATDAVVQFSAAHPPEEQASAAEVPTPEDGPVRPEQQPTPVTPSADVDSTPVNAPASRPVDEPSEWDVALQAMRDAAEAAHFAEQLPQQFRQSFGHPIEQGTAEEFRKARELIASAA